MDSKQKPSPSADTKSVPNQFLKHFKFQLADAGRTSMGETVLTIEIGVYWWLRCPNLSTRIHAHSPLMLLSQSSHEFEFGSKLLRFSLTKKYICIFKWLVFIRLNHCLYSDDFMKMTRTTQTFKFRYPVYGSERNI